MSGIIVSEYRGISGTAEEDIRVQPGGASPWTFPWRIHVRKIRRPCAAAAVAAFLIASSAAVTWSGRFGFGLGHPVHALKSTAAAATSGAVEVEIKKTTRAPASFLPTSYGARGCPSGTVTVPDSEICRQYAAIVQDKGLCEKSNGYGPDCDGPESGRAPWCSSRPLGCWQSRNGCTYFKASGTDEPQLDVRPVCQVVGNGPPSPDSLYCLSVLGSTVDRELLEMQHREKLGVFACDGHTIYSERKMELGRLSDPQSGESQGPVATAPLHMKISCISMGLSKDCFGEKTYVEIWKHVLRAGHFRDFAWTLKASADAVFLPNRARGALRGLWDPPRGVYVANCRRGMGADQFELHGALETFSRNALEMYGKGSHFCLSGSTRLLFDHWSEALFMDECMKKLGVYRRLDENFVLEPRCSASEPVEGHVSCTRKDFVAFYPFRRAQGFRECAESANSQERSASSSSSSSSSTSSTTTANADGKPNTTSFETALS